MNALKNLSLILLLSLAFTGCHNKSSKLNDFNLLLYVPEYVSTVKISGAVMYPNTVLYKAGEGWKYYVNQAGGFGNDARKRRAYVVHMNGTVSRLKSGGAKEIEPGCEIIVPSKDPKKKMSPAEIIGMGTSAASLATMIATLVNLFK